MYNATYEASLLIGSAIIVNYSKTDYFVNLL